MTLTLTFEMVPSMSWLSLRDSYTRDVIWMQGLLFEETDLNTNDYIQKTKQMNHVTHSANSILQKPSHIQACIDSCSPFGPALTHIPAFGHTLTQGVNRCVLFLLENDFTSLHHQMTS
jgi:hypothetical protein